MEVKLKLDGTEVIAYDNVYEEMDENNYWGDPLADRCDYHLKINNKDYRHKSTARYYNDYDAKRYDNTKLEFNKKEDWQTSEEFINDFITQTFGTVQSFSNDELSDKVQRISEIEAERQIEYDKIDNDPLSKYLDFFYKHYLEEAPGGGLSSTSFLKEENCQLMMNNLKAIAEGKPVTELSVKNVLSFKDRNFNPKKNNSISKMIDDQNKILKLITNKMLEETGSIEEDFSTNNYSTLKIKRYKFLSKKYHQLKREQNQLIGEVFNSLFIPLYRKEKIKECDDYCDKHNKSRGPGYDNKAPKSPNEQALKRTVKKAKDLKKRIARHDLSERGIIPEDEKVSGTTQIGKKQQSFKIPSETLNKFKSFNLEK